MYIRSAASTMEIRSTKAVVATGTTVPLHHCATQWNSDNSEKMGNLADLKKTFVSLYIVYIDLTFQSRQ